MTDTVYSYQLKRGEPSSFDHAVPTFTSFPTGQRLLCSGKEIKKIEIIFPIRLTSPTPKLTILSESRRIEREIDFTSEFSNPSRAVWIIDEPIKLDNKYLEFNISRDCGLNLYF
jgi:hypothetical protein